MPVARFFRSLAPARGQENGAIGETRDQPVALQPLNRPRHGHVRDPKPPCQVDHARLASRGDQLGNDLDIILRNLVGMFFSRSAWVPMWERRTALAGFRGLGGWRHGGSKTKQASVDNCKNL